MTTSTRCNAVIIRSGITRRCAKFAYVDDTGYCSGLCDAHLEQWAEKATVIEVPRPAKLTPLNLLHAAAEKYHQYDAWRRAGMYSGRILPVVNEPHP